MEVNLDGSVNLPWKISRGTHNAFTLTFTEDISGFSNWKFNVKLKGGADSSVISLIEDSGLTIESSTQISGFFTKTQSSLKKSNYYYEILYDNAAGETSALFRSEFIVQNENSSDTTSDVSVSPNMDGTTVNVSVTLLGFDSDIALSEFATELTFDSDQEFETVTGGTRTFTLAASGHKNGIVIVARIDKPVAVNFPEGFEALSGSDDISTTAMNIVIFRYFSDYDGAGNGKVLYIVRNQTALS